MQLLYFLLQDYISICSTINTIFGCEEVFMLYYVGAAAASVLSFILTFLCMKFLPLGDKLLGHDRGRLYAAGSEVNIGKPTGVGFYFVFVTVIVSLIFTFSGSSYLFMMILVLLSMLFGFLDDRSKNPWGEYIKGALDFLIAGIGAAVFTLFYGTDVIIGITGYPVHIPLWLFFFLAVMLIIVSVNATNATDGVDGLSGTLTILTLITFMIVARINGTINYHGYVRGFVLIAALIAYLIFNFNPSKVLMGDAGSRAIGFFIAFYAMYLKIPFAYLIVCLPFLIDGGLSILKITIGRLTKKKVIILKNITTPIHDHLKKRKGFSVKKTWAVIVACAAVLDLIYVAVCAVV